MAFPVIQSVSSGTQTSNATDWTDGPFPSGVVAGDLLLAFGSADGAGNVAFTGFSLIGNVSPAGAVTLVCRAKIADGSETGNILITCSASEQGAWRCFRISGWYGTGLPSSSNSHDGAGVDSVTNSGTGVATADPANLDPGQWATQDTLWFAACGIDTSRTISVYPLADNNTADVSGGAGGATLGLCTTTSAVSSLDPGTFTFSAADDWAALTVAVRPAAIQIGLPPRPLFVEMRPNV